MVTFKAACRIATINFAKWKKDYRIWFIFICIAILIHNYFKPLIGLCEREGFDVTIYVVTMLFERSLIGTGAPKITMYVGMLLLLCDAPFLHQVVPYAVLRSRRKSWFLGECLYIMGVAFCYMAFISLVSGLCVLPYAVFDNSWGTALEGLMYGNEIYSADEIWSMLSSQIPLQREAIRYLYSDATFLYTFFFGWATFVLLGMIVYAVSLVKNNIIWGMSIAGIFIFVEPLITTLHNSNWWLHQFSPVSWSSVAHLEMVDRFNHLEIPTIVLYLVISLVVVFILAWRFSRRKMIELR